MSRNWAVAYRAATSETVKQAIAARIEIWDRSVAALYFGLLGVHMLSSICFAIATRTRGTTAPVLLVIEASYQLAELGRTPRVMPDDVYRVFVDARTEWLAELSWLIRLIVGPDIMWLDCKS